MGTFWLSSGDIQVVDGEIYTQSGNSIQWSIAGSTSTSEILNLLGNLFLPITGGEIDGALDITGLTRAYGGLEVTNGVTADIVYASTGNSNSWQNTYTTVRSNSASWALDSTTDTAVRALTANWQNTYTNVLANSASWNAGTSLANYLPLSGGVISANSSTDALRITQTGTGNALIVEDSTNPDATPLVVDQSGNFLVGLQTPLNIIHNAGGGSLGNITPRVQNFGSSGASAANAILISNTSSNPAMLYIGRARGIVGGTGTTNLSAVSATENLGKISIGGYDGQTYIEGAAIQGVVSGNVSISSVPTDLIFRTSTTGISALSEKLRVTASGNVGIGTDTPNEKLTIVGNISSTSVVYASGGNSNLWRLEDFMVACSDEITDLITNTSAVTFRVPFGMYLNSVRASVNTAPVGSTIIVDVKQNGTSIFSTLLTIDENEETSTTAATPVVISNPNLTDDAKIVVSINQVGSTTPGNGLKVTFKGYRV
jgi:hypothetical protein